MYGNYSHFVKFPAGFGGECGASGQSWGGGGDAGTAKGTGAESYVHMPVRRARVSVRVQERGQSRRG